MARVPRVDNLITGKMNALLHYVFQLALLAAALACWLQFASARVPNSGSGMHAARSLLQGTSESVPDLKKRFIATLQAIKHGNKQEHDGFLDYQYWLLGCGGVYCSWDPDAAAADMLNIFTKDPSMIKAGVSDMYTNIAKEAMDQIHQSPPTKQQCVIWCNEVVKPALQGDSASSATDQQQRTTTQAARSLVQDTPVPDYTKRRIQTLQAIKNGSKEEYDKFLDYQYWLLGCGGVYCSQGPDAAAAEMLEIWAKDPSLIKAGVLDTYTNITKEAMHQIHQSPPTKQQCDIWCNQVDPEVPASNATGQDLTTSSQDHSSLRLLLQADSNVKPVDADAKMIKDLQAVKNGDVRMNKTMIAFQYFYIGCGGSTRDRAPDSVAAALNRNIAGDRQYNEAGVAETFSDLVMIGLSEVHKSPPTTNDCDKFWNDAPGRRLLHFTRLDA